MEAQATQQTKTEPGVTESHLQALETVLRKIIQSGGFSLAVTIRKLPAAEETGGPEWVADFSGPDADILIASHAELLDAMAYVASKAVRLDDSLHKKIIFDCLDYRRTRAEELKLTARLAADRVIDSGESFALNPMNSLERRIIHLALKDEPRIRTESQGMGPARHVVILPASLPHPER